MNDDEHAIREVIATWLRASAAGDTDTVLGLMADDVVFLVPGKPPFGKKEFAEGQRGWHGRFRMQSESNVEEVRVAGDFACTRTHLAITMTPVSGGTKMRKRGWVLSVYQRRADGGWLLARDANLLTDA
jgi:uncharacterized protein (TIGR02246 family)